MKDSRRLMGNAIRYIVAMAACWLGSDAIESLAGGGVEPAKSTKQEQRAEPVGCYLAPGMISLLEDEIRAGLKKREVEKRFEQFVEYAGKTLDTSANGRSSSEMRGNCRLKWYDKMYRNPLGATAEGEKFTRDLHQAVIAGRNDLRPALAMAMEKLDLKTDPSKSSLDAHSANDVLKILSEGVAEAKNRYLAAMSPLTSTEQSTLRQGLYPVLTEQNRVGHTLEDRTNGHRLMDLLERIDRSSMCNAAFALLPLTDEHMLQQLCKLPGDSNADLTVAGVTGTIVRRISTTAGDIIVGGKEKNVYDLDKMTNVCAVVDLAGDDEYREGSVSAERPVLVVIDLAGNDSYVASAPGSQAGAVLGISMLLDLEGNDTYRARDVAQGSALGGVAILVDYSGNDVYAGYRRVQGQAITGIGVLVDRSGNDRYHAAMWGQGFGGPLGFGLFDDLSGNDHYSLGGLYTNSFKPETPGYEGWGQGVGAGLRQVADGGVGVFLEGSGDDRYEYDYLSHGGGYWFGIGLARDFGGNDQRLGGTQQAFEGGKRREPQYQRYTCGWGCHFAMGFCFDDAGNDTYGGTIMGLGFAWDMSVGVLCDFAGNDRYEAAKQNTQGSGAQAGLGILFDYEGNDVYLGQGQAYASTSISYHSRPSCGGNFSFLVDYGGNDEYGCGIENNSYNQRGSDGSFLIDRPSRKEEAKQRVADAPATKHGTEG